MERKITITRADLILHPIRMRLLVMLVRRQLTARQLSTLLPELPLATLYHHLGLLTRAKLLRIVSTRQVHGAVEKVYTFADEDAFLGPAELANASPDDHLRYFTIFATTLIAEFARYIQQDAPIDFATEGIGYREMVLHVSDEEFARATAALSQALLPFLGNAPSLDRRSRHLAIVTFPAGEELRAAHGTGVASTTPPA